MSRWPGLASSGEKAWLATFGFLALAAAGCTGTAVRNFPAERAASHAPATSSAVRGQLKSFLVEDARRRWSFSTRALDRPGLDELSGYAQVEIGGLGSQALYCFVYEQPLDPGRAIARFLAVAEEGIEFERLELLAVEQAAAEPLLFFRAPYAPLNGSDEQPGVLNLALRVGAEFPVLCSHDEVGEGAAFRKRVREAMSEFVVAAKMHAGPTRMEIWRGRHGAALRGVRIFRQWSLDAAVTTSIVSTSTFFFQQGLRTRDEALVEVEDQAGLRKSELVILSGERLRTRVVLLRDDRKSAQNQQRFRYQGLVGGLQVAGAFEWPEPLSSSRAVWVRSGGDLSAARQLWLYQPLLRVDAPVQVVIESSEDRILSGRWGIDLQQQVRVELDAELFPQHVVLDESEVPDWERIHVSSKATAPQPSEAP